MNNKNSDPSCLHKERYAEVSLSMPDMPAITISYANNLEILLIDFTILYTLIALLYTVNILGLTDCVILILDQNLPAKAFAFVLRSVQFSWLARLVRLYLGLIGVILMLWLYWQGLHPWKFSYCDKSKASKPRRSTTRGIPNAAVSDAHRNSLH